MLLFQEVVTVFTHTHTEETSAERSDWLLHHVSAVIVAPFTVVRLVGDGASGSDRLLLLRNKRTPCSRARARTHTRDLHHNNSDLSFLPC